MRSLIRLSLPLAALVWVGAAAADVTSSSPHDYDRLPRNGREGGTYAFNGYFSAGPPGCTGAVIGTAKFLPNPDGSGGQLCAKFNVEIEAGCATAPLANSTLMAAAGTYTYNGDGTLCEQTVFVGGPLAGMSAVFHTYVDPKGRWLLASSQDVAYAGCGAPANGPVISNAIANKVSNRGDDPPGSGTLACTLP